MTVQQYINDNPDFALEIQNVNHLFSAFDVQIDEVIVCAQLVKYIIKLPLDIDIQDKIRRSESKIKFALSSAITSSDYNYGHESDYVYIERPSKLQVVNFSSYDKSKFKTDKLVLALGMDKDGKKLITDLRKAPHILVGGTTGSGKSELLHCFVASLISGMPYTGVELLIIDPKRAEFSPYKSCKGITLCTEMKEASGFLKQAVEIMEKRYVELERNGAKDITKYKGSEDMHPIVIIIDELADLIQIDRTVEDNIIRIAQKARACGIHLIIGTQSPRKDVVTGLIKANIPTKIALKTTNQTESRIILDQKGAESLYGKGDMLFLSNGSFTPIRLQSAFVSESQKIVLADSIYMEKPIKEQQTDSSNSLLEEMREMDRRFEEAVDTMEKPKKKHVGLIGSMINIMKVKPIMIKTDDFPPKV